jgi:hypothetical protein
MHRDIDLFRQQRPLNLGGKHSFPTRPPIHRFGRAVRDFVTARLDDFDFDGEIGPRSPQGVLHHFGLRSG